MSSEKKKRERRNHSAEFKAETVQMVRSGARTVGQLSVELDLADSLIRSWVRQADVDSGRGEPGAMTSAEREELSRLRQEVKVLRMEREILKRAATFFAKENT